MAEHFCYGDISLVCCKECYENVLTIQRFGLILRVKNGSLVLYWSNGIPDSELSVGPDAVWDIGERNLDYSKVALLRAAVDEIKARKLRYSNPAPTVQATPKPDQPREDVEYMRIVFDDDKPFSEKEETDDGTVRKAGFEIRDGSKVVGRCKMAVVERDGEDPTFSYAIGPSKDVLGVDLSRTEELSGETAIAFCELVSAAFDLLARHGHRDSRHSGDTVRIDLGVERDF